MSRFENPIFCALDTTDLERAAALAHDLRGAIGGIKIGMELFHTHGADGYRRIAQSGLPVFLDLKLHDIPNTVAAAIRAVLPLRPAIIDLHATGGPAMMRAARTAADEAGKDAPRVVAVTVLTSLEELDLEAIGFHMGGGRTASDLALRLAALAAEAGLDGAVCATGDTAAIRQRLGTDFLTVVPGIRPASAAAGDQKRIADPRSAIDSGADILVVGRPITAAADPVAAANAILAECRAAERMRVNEEP